MIEEIIVQEKALLINARVFKSSLPVLTRLHGLKCDIYNTLGNSGNYDKDGKDNYLLKPTKTERHIVFSYFQLGQNNSYAFDPFDEKPRVIVTTLAGKLGQNAKVVVWHGSSYYEFRVNNFLGYRGKNDLILVLNVLIPLV